MPRSLRASLLTVLLTAVFTQAALAQQATGVDSNAPPVPARQPASPLSSGQKPDQESGLAAEPRNAAGLSKTAAAAEPLPGAPPATSPPATPPASSKDNRLLLTAILILLTSIAVKTIIMIKQLYQRRENPGGSASSPVVETTGLRRGRNSQPTRVPVAKKSMATKPASSPAAAAGTVVEPDREPAPVIMISPSSKKQRPVSGRKTAAATSRFPVNDNELIVDAGQLGKTRVAQLLKRCTELPLPAILRVRTAGNEICVHFASGQLCHASVRDWRVAGEHRQWSKLGHLMVREGLISEAQHERALEVMQQREGLRLGAALLQLGAIDAETLQQVLARQAKSVILFLVLYPEGEYRIEADRGTIPVEESFALPVAPLLREVAHRQGDWGAIRTVMPTLGTLLRFTAEGRDKLAQAQLSVSQSLLLAQVGDRATLDSLCGAATMTNYEACRFLYLMVKAGVLEVIPSD